MESLNLLRYLVLRDNILRNAVSKTYLTPTIILVAIWLLQKPSTFPRFFQVGVWAEVCRLKDKYLTILRVCISLSRTYYCAEVKSLREEQKQKAKGKNELPGSLIVYHSLFEIQYLNCVLTEAKDATRATRLVKSLKVKHEKVASFPPEVQHQV